MKTWFQVWLPPFGDRTEVKLFGMRVENGRIDSSPNGYQSLVGCNLDFVKEQYEKRGGIISEIGSTD